MESETKLEDKYFHKVRDLITEKYDIMEMCGYISIDPNSSVITIKIPFGDPDHFIKHVENLK